MSESTGFELTVEKAKGPLVTSSRLRLVAFDQMVAVLLMNKRSFFLLFVIAALMLAGVGPSSAFKIARAQGFFGAQRWPAIDVDNNDNLYLMMSVATAPASEHRP